MSTCENTHPVPVCQQLDTPVMDEPGTRHVRNPGVLHLSNGWTHRPPGRKSSSPSAKVTVMFGQLIDDARAEALFVTDIQRSECPTSEQVRAAIIGAFHRHGGSRNCAALVAQEFGEHPETAVVRMCWARRAVQDAFHAEEHAHGEFEAAAAGGLHPAAFGLG
ncbi:MAG: hypothetical protein JWO79_2296 [Actinomycetia bacterium]|nr:hypothetical protein [Actinomycetes bacterium]